MTEASEVARCDDSPDAGLRMAGSSDLFLTIAAVRTPMVCTDARSEENRVIYANPQFLALFGFECDELLGRPFSTLVVTDPPNPRISPESIAAMENGARQLKCRHKDGSKINAIVLSSPVVETPGRVERYLTSFLPMAAGLANCSETRHQTREIYEHAPGFIAFTEGPTHRFTFANSAYETLVNRRGFVGRTVAEAFPDFADQGFIGLLDKVYQTGEHMVGRRVPIMIARGPNGEKEQRYIDYLYQPVRNMAGEVTGLFCEGSDVTDVQRVRKKLDEAQAQLIHMARSNAMGTMAATLAHELNQPLAAISNYAAGCTFILEEEGLGDGRLHEGLISIAAASERAGQVISRLRGLTKRSPPVNEVFDLSQALEDAAQIVRAGDCKFVTISSQRTQSAMVRGDKIQIEQVIINLLRNACEAAARGRGEGAVVAVCFPFGAQACVTVRDNGPGLSPKAEADLFNWTDSTKPGGMGIGLSICRTIVESHGGHIVLERTDPSGTTFRFCLPNQSESH